ncbi:unnamed protein product [Allacma fusca]|uniref:Peptidase S1 domain-containing protein n=1 Tax=Allacma fusca TaxID=39272 RepID=A0A8J2PSB7_9HEXA|nr:unnamed protein product [Allacma fusca]
MIWRLFFILPVLLTAPNSGWGQVKKAKMFLGLSQSICGQYSEYLSSQIMPPPLKKPIKGELSISGEAIWTECGSSKSCTPFTFFKSGPADGKTYPRIPKYKVTENKYPFLVAMGQRFYYHVLHTLAGHGVLIHPKIFLTSASNLLEFDKVTASQWYIQRYRMVQGSLTRYHSDVNVQWCDGKIHPKFNLTTRAYDFALVAVRTDIVPWDKMKNVTFAQKGQSFKGPCKYPSWGKTKIINNLYAYPNNLMDGTVNVLPNEECISAGYSNTHFCTPPVLCGLMDSGSPLICTENNTDYIIGLSSYYKLNLDKVEICGGNVLSAFTSILDLDMEWVQKGITEFDEYCNPLPTGFPPKPSRLTRIFIF